MGCWRRSLTQALRQSGRWAARGWLTALDPIPWPQTPLPTYMQRLSRDASRMPAGMHVSVKPWLCASQSDADVSSALTSLPEGVVYRLDGAGCRDLDTLLAVYRSVRSQRPDIRIALVAGLARTRADLQALGEWAYEVRLVKGASDVLQDAHHVDTAQALIELGSQLAYMGMRPGICTGDTTLWRALREWPSGSAEIETPALPQALAQAPAAPQPLRFYLPYGPGALMFGAVRTLLNAGWRRRLIGFRLRRGVG